MEAQEIYDKVKAHLLTQGERSTDMGNHCLYRGPNGLKCAVGCLIPDDLYDPLMEAPGNNSVIAVAALCPALRELWGGHNLGLISVLQGVHDGYHPIVWKKRLSIAAIKYGLDP